MLGGTVGPLGAAPRRRTGLGAVVRAARRRGPTAVAGVGPLAGGTDLVTTGVLVRPVAGPVVTACLPPAVRQLAGPAVVGTVCGRTTVGALGAAVLVARAVRAILVARAVIRTTGVGAVTRAVVRTTGVGAVTGTVIRTTRAGAIARAGTVIRTTRAGPVPRTVIRTTRTGAVPGTVIRTTRAGPVPRAIVGAGGAGAVAVARAVLTVVGTPGGRAICVAGAIRTIGRRATIVAVGRAAAVGASVHRSVLAPPCALTVGATTRTSGRPGSARTHLLLGGRPALLGTFGRAARNRLGHGGNSSLQQRAQTSAITRCGRTRASPTLPSARLRPPRPDSPSP